MDQQIRPVPPVPPGPTDHGERTYIAVNVVPLSAGIVLSSFTDVPAVSLYGNLTLGIVWSVLQCGLFVATAWAYEIRHAAVSR